MSEIEQLKRAAVLAVIDRYHQTRLADSDLAAFLLADTRVDEALNDLVRLYITG